MNGIDSLPQLRDCIVGCCHCPRLVAHREHIAHVKVARHREEDYWGKPVPPFGDPDAKILILGLAPAAHGGNRTGRSFTGDPSGDWLFGALHRAGFASQPTSTSSNDGLSLNDVYITNAVRCAPPDNKPNPDEKLACRPFLVKELELMQEVRVVIPLGKFAFDAYLQTRSAAGLTNPKPRPTFGHGNTCLLDGGVTLLSSYHPSRQNTQTGKLTLQMLDDIFLAAKELIADGNPDKR